MSEEKREPASLVYEKTERGASVEMRGTRFEIVQGIVRLIYSAAEKTGLDVNRFAVSLPALLELEKLGLSATECIDFEAIRKEMMRGDNAPL